MYHWKRNGNLLCCTILSCHFETKKWHSASCHCRRPARGVVVMCFSLRKDRVTESIPRMKATLCSSPLFLRLVPSACRCTHALWSVISPSPPSSVPSSQVSRHPAVTGLSSRAPCPRCRVTCAHRSHLGLLVVTLAPPGGFLSKAPETGSGTWTSSAFDLLRAFVCMFVSSYRQGTSLALYLPELDSSVNNV